MLIAKWTFMMLVLLILVVITYSNVANATAQVPDSGREPAWYVGLLRSKAAAAQRFNFDADVDLSRKDGESPRESVAHFRVRLAVAPGHKYLLSVGHESAPDATVVCDGYKTWAFMRSTNRYVELEGITTRLAADPEVAFSEGVASEDGEPGLCSGLVVPILAGLDQHAAAVMDMKSSADTSMHREERELPVLTILSGRNEAGVQTLTDVTLDPETFAVARLAWSKSILTGEKSRFVFLTANFLNFQLGEQIPPSYFAFNPGGAQKVEELPIPGLDGAALVGKPTPDFQVETPTLGKVKASDLRGRTVLLAFLGNDCAPCMKQSSVLAAIQQEYKDRGLLIVEASEKNRMLYGLFHVRFAPTIVLINAQGVVVRFLAGVRNDVELRDALRLAGM